MRNTRRIPALLPVLTLVVLICGCGTSEPDGRYEQLVEKTLEQQAAQNQAMAKQSQEVAEATRQLVEADAKARQEMAATHRDLQTGLQSERKNIDRQHDALEQERREIESQRHRDPIIAQAIIQVGGYLAAVVPLALAFVLLRSLQHEDPDALVGELLLQEFTSERPLLIDRQWTAPAALEHERQAALPLADEDTPDASPEQDEKPED